jgi:enoyl-CoA hydratase
VIEYVLDAKVARIRIDVGKVNALTLDSIDALLASLDTALQDGASAVVLSGRPGVFSAGFDLNEVRQSAQFRDTLRVRLTELMLRLFEFELPVIVACTGHAMAAGAALLLAGDWRIGVDGPYKLGFNEISVGVPISGFTAELARYRMPAPWFESIMTAQLFLPDEAVRAGLLDEVVANEEELDVAALRTAHHLGSLAPLFSKTKRLIRGAALERMRAERDRLISEVGAT